MAKVESFRFWCQKVLPLVYDDSLSYYELLCKMVTYLNNTIQAVNVNTEDVSNMRSELTQFESNITSRQDSFESRILNIINQLESYIDNYFENLDVQEEINNKLNAMASDGTLTTLMQPFLEQLTINIDSEIVEVQREVDVLEGRMDEFTNLPEGSTTGDAELADIRVGGNGITYPTAGDAVRGQYNALSSAMLLDRNKATRLSANTDFDTLITVGNYYVGTTGDAQSMLHIPAQIAGRLTVMTLLNGVVLQLYDGRVGSNSRRFWRLRNDNNIFGSWFEDASLQDINAKSYVLDRSDAQRIAVNTDIDTITLVGNYYVGSASEAETMTDLPVASAGRLTVMTLLNGVIMQTYDGRKAGTIKRFWRLKDASNPWTDWWETASFEDIYAKSVVLDRSNATRLSASTDFDTLNVIGNYYVGNTSDAQSMDNIPTSSPGRLTVTTLLNNVWMQTYDAREGNVVRRFWRVKDDVNEWGDWEEVDNKPKYRKLIEYNSGEEYPYGQGCCITDRYIYICSILDNTSEIIYQYDKFTFELLDSYPFTGQIQHGNDFTWNPTTKKIYCANGGGSKTVTVFDENLNYIESITVDLDIVSLSGIAYDTVSGLWCVSGGNNLKLYILENLTDTEPLATITYDATAEFQGIAFRNYVIYGISSVGAITILTMSGAVADTTRVGKAFGEFENIKVIGDKVYYNVQDHTNQKGVMYCTPLDYLTNIPTLY